MYDRGRAKPGATKGEPDERRLQGFRRRCARRVSRRSLVEVPRQEVRRSGRVASSPSTTSTTTTRPRSTAATRIIRRCSTASSKSSWSGPPTTSSAKYGDLMTKGFTGERVTKALALDGVDMAVIYGPEFDMWADFVDPEMQAAMARAYNRWGQEMRETSNNHVHISSPVPIFDVSRAVEEITYAYEHLGARCFWTRPNTYRGRNLGDSLLRPHLGSAPRSRLRVRHARVHGSQGHLLRARPLHELHRMAHRGASDGGHGCLHVDDRARRVRALPPVARRLHGIGLRMVAVVAAPHRRAPRVGRAPSSPTSR